MLAKGANPASVAKELHLFWKVKDAFMAQVQRLSLEQIAGLLVTLAEIDYQVKTGQARTEVAIEQVVLSMGKLAGLPGQMAARGSRPSLPS